LPSPEDPLGRCANCIRLKRECSFYPVDHTPDGSRLNTSTSATNSPSSPLTPNQLSDSISPQHADYEAGSSTDSYSLGYPGSRSLSLPFPTSLPDNLPMHPGFTISSVSENEEWAMGSHPHRPLPPGGQTSPYWASEASTPNTSNFPPNIPNLESGGSYENSPLPSYPHTEQREQQPWAPTRSLSYSHLEGLHHQHHYGGSYPGLSTTLPDGLSPFGHPSTPSPGDPGGSHPPPGLPNTYRLPDQHSTYGNPWLAPDHQAPDQGSSSSQQWYAEPSHVAPTQDHDPDEYDHANSLYPPRTHPS
jgi:hypothetical protein